MFAILDILCFKGQEDAFALAACLGFHNVALFFFAAFNCLSELGVVCRQVPCSGEEVIVRGKLATHLHKAESKEVLPGEHVDAGEMADLLKEVHLEECLGFDHGVDPEEVPISFFPAALHPPVKRFGHIRDNIILGHYG